jgi:hypothetical protein
MLSQLTKADTRPSIKQHVKQHVGLGHSRRFDDVCVTAYPPIAAVSRTSRHFAFVPLSDVVDMVEITPARQRGA